MRLKKIFYSGDFRHKISELKKYLFVQFGDSFADGTIRAIIEGIRKLQDNELLGASVQAMFGVETEYRYIFVAHQYVFYRVTETEIRIVNMYHEREEFMEKLFGTPSS